MVTWTGAGQPCRHGWPAALGPRTSAWAWRADGRATARSTSALPAALLMGSAMATIMLAFMWGMMYKNVAINIAIVAGALVLGLTALWLSRSQTFGGRPGVHERDYRGCRIGRLTTADLVVADERRWPPTASPDTHPGRKGRRTHSRAARTARRNTGGRRSPPAGLVGS